MTEVMKRTIATLKAMTDVSDRLLPYTANCDDITEMIELLNYNSKIDKVIKWITNYDVSTPVAAPAEHAVPIPAAEPIPVTAQTEAEQPKYAESFTFNLSDYMNSINAEINTVVNADTDSEEDVEDNGQPIEFDKEFINYSTYENLDTETANEVIENYDKQKWLKLDNNAEWRRNTLYPVMVSDSGLFFDLIENKVMTPYWHAGEMFIDVIVDDELVQKRCGAMIAGVFRIKKPNAIEGDPHVVDFKDGDRRNLRLDNLCFGRKSQKPSNTELLINDVCRRCVEYKFSVAKVVSLYAGDDEVEITAEFVKDLIAKKQRADISDKYWKLDNHKKPVVKETKLPSSGFVNIADLFLQGETIENCEVMFDAKISGNYDLTDAEIELLCNIAKRALPAEAVKFSNIAVYIINNYKWEITAETVKTRINKPTVITQTFNERIKALESEATA